MTLPNLTDTIVALATPPGTGAIAVIRLAGPDAIALTDRIFKGKILAKQNSHTAHFGRIENTQGHVVDEVLATVFHAPRSYTGDDAVEISCHGSPYIQQAIIELCLSQGARMAQPGEFTLRAFLNGKLDLSQAEAVADLVASQSAAAHAVALRQLRGGFKNEIARLRAELIHFASLVELELDFSEEDVEFADRTELKSLVEKIRSYTQSLLHTFQLGNALKTGVATVIAGRPNAGKSTLLNALLNEERAIVSEIAGTTRDTIEEVLNINGVQFRLIDTAGIREAQDQIEALGVQRTMEKIEQAAIVVYLWDVTAMTLAEVYGDLERLKPPPAPPLGGEAGFSGPSRKGKEFPEAGLGSPSRKGMDASGEAGLGGPSRKGKEASGETGLSGPSRKGKDASGEAGLGGPSRKGKDAPFSPPNGGAGGGSSLLVVCNKMDRNPHFKTEWLLHPDAPEVHPYLQSDPPAQNTIGLTAEQVIPISAKNEQNIGFLKEKLFDLAIGDGINLEGTIVTNVRHFAALKNADEALADVLTGLDSGITGDFIALDIRRALNFLGEITGEIGVEDLLGNIFGKFCIGK